MRPGGTSVPIILWRWSCVKATACKTVSCRASARCARLRRAVACAAADVVMAAEVGRFFHDLRVALRLTPDAGRASAGNRVDIVARLELGQIGALAAVARDVPYRAHLRRLCRTRSASGPAFAGTALRVDAPRGPRRSGIAPRPRMPDFGQGAPLLRAIGGGGRRAAEAARNVRRAVNDRAGRPGMALFTVTMGVALILLITQTAVLEAAVSQLPPSMKRIVRGAQNYVIVQPCRRSAMACAGSMSPIRARAGATNCGQPPNRIRCGAPRRGCLYPPPVETIVGCLARARPFASGLVRELREHGWNPTRQARENGRALERDSGGAQRRGQSGGTTPS